MKTTLELPVPLFRQMKQYSAQRGMTLKELVVAALMLFFRKDVRQAQTFKLRDGSYGQGGLQKGVVEGKWFSEIYEGRGG